MGGTGAGRRNAVRCRHLPARHTREKLVDVVGEQSASDDHVDPAARRSGKDVNRAGGAEGLLLILDGLGVEETAGECSDSCWEAGCQFVVVSFEATCANRIGR